MFDRDGYIGYVGDKSGVTYAYGLSRIEALCSVSIDDEFENDRCASLLSTLDNMMAENGDAGAELKKVSAKSKLRKYIEFKEEPFQPKEPIVEQFRECLKDISIGTRNEASGYYRAHQLSIWHKGIQHYPQRLLL